MEKDELRKKYLDIRKNILNKEAKSQIIIEKVIQSDEYQKAQVLLLYYSLPSEVKTIPLILDALKKKKKVYLPKVCHDELVFYRLFSLDDPLVKNSFGVYEPVSNEKLKDQVDLCILPGVCFDKDMHRLGFGKGYYDRFLKDNFCFKMALAFEETILDEAILASPWDILMDKIITEQQEICLSRCSWVNLKNPLDVLYHDKEWGVYSLEEQRLYEFLVLESFQAGLSWECILNKRENFRKALDNFEVEKIACYSKEKIASLLENKGLIRNRLKMEAMVKNSQIFLAIQKEFGSFGNYLKTFTKGNIWVERHKRASSLADKIAKDLQKRGMKFVGGTIIYAYLQAIGVINAHDNDCFKSKSL